MFGATSEKVTPVLDSLGDLTRRMRLLELSHAFYQRALRLRIAAHSRPTMAASALTHASAGQGGVCSVRSALHCAHCRTRARERERAADDGIARGNLTELTPDHTGRREADCKAETFVTGRVTDR